MTTKTKGGKKMADNSKIDFDKINEYAKVLGIPAKGKKKDEFINDVLDAIVEQYTAKEGELTSEDFDRYKEENQEMLQFYMSNKDYEGEEPEKEVVEESETAEGVDVEEPEDMAEEEPETAGEPVVEEKLEVIEEPVVKKKAKKKVEKKEVAGTRKPIERGRGIGAFICDGLRDGSFKGMSNREIAERAVEKFHGNTNAGNIGWYKNKLRKEGLKVVV